MTFCYSNIRYTSVHDELNSGTTFQTVSLSGYMYNYVGKSLDRLNITIYYMACTIYTRVQVECVYKSNPIFEAKNTTFLEKV